MEKEKAREAALADHRAESARKRQKFGISQEDYEEIVKHEVTPPCYIDAKGNSVALSNSSKHGLITATVSRCVTATLAEPLQCMQKTAALAAEVKKKSEREKIAVDKANGRPKLKSVTGTREGLCLTGDSTLGGLLAVKEGNAAAEAEAAVARDAKAPEETMNTTKALKEAHRKFSTQARLNTAEKTAIVIAYFKVRGADKKRLTDIRKSMKKADDATKVYDATFSEVAGEGAWPWTSMGISTEDTALLETSEVVVPALVSDAVLPQAPGEQCGDSVLVGGDFEELFNGDLLDFDVGFDFV